MSASRRRLRPYLFVVRKADGSKQDAVFYALTAAAAKRYAEAWAAKHGFSVALVPDGVAS